MPNIPNIKKFVFSQNHIIFLFAFLEHASINLIIPLLTLIFFDMHSSLFPQDTSIVIRSFWYGMATAIYQIGGMMGSPMLGYVSDYYGREKLLKLCGCGVLFASLLGMSSLFLRAMTLLLISRLISGICVSNAVGQAAIGDLCAGKNKIIQMGYFQAAIAFGAFAGPLLASYFMRPYFFEKFSFFTPFMLSLILALAGIYLLFHHFPKTLFSNVRCNSLSFENIKSVIKNKRVLKISCLLLMSQISWSLYYQYITPLLKNKFSIDASHIFLFFSFIAGYIILGSTLCLKIIRRLISSTESIILFGNIFILVGLLLTCLAIHFNIISLIWISAIPIGMGDVIAFSAIVTLYSDTVASNQQGAVMGICLIVRQCAWTLTGMIGGILFGIQVTLPLMIAPFSVLFLILFLSVNQGLFFRSAANGRLSK